MAIDKENYEKINKLAAAKNCTLVAVSKTKPVEDIRAIYELGQRDFGENYVQELTDKQAELPEDTRWHFIGHLQSNKVKYIAPFVYLIHGVDSEKLLTEINKQAKKIDRKINCLLQVHIAREDTKFGMDEKELAKITKKIKDNFFPNVVVMGLMGMASNADDNEIARNEFHSLHEMYLHYKMEIPSFAFLSMGMSGDYVTAIDEGSNMIRIGSLLFGVRN